MKFHDLDIDIVSIQPHTDTYRGESWRKVSFNIDNNSSSNDNNIHANTNMENKHMSNNKNGSFSFN
jgi:hypothetical protein